jgi:leucyl aminopeptidase
VLRLTTIDIKNKKLETLVVPVCEDADIYKQTALKRLTDAAKNHKEFVGKSKEMIVLYDIPGIQAERVVFIGLGKAGEISAENLRQCAGTAVKYCIAQKLSSAVIAAPTVKTLPVVQQAVLEAIMEGAYLGNHIFDAFKSEKGDSPLKRVAILVPEGVQKRFGGLAKKIQTICDGTLLARNWVSTPPNAKTPVQFAGIVSRLAKKEKLTVTVLDQKNLSELGFGALLAVAAGSKNPPRLLILDYRPKGAQKTLALIGKGVTFDSGGINLKPSGSLADMKMDMAGAAVVGAAMIALAKLKPGQRIIGAMPLVENMPSGTAARPGDIIKTYTGKTVEIGNTDAEGRLILADTLAYIEKKYKPGMVIDLATLTGACVMALGEKIAGTFSTNDALAESIAIAGEQTHERCWRLPMPDDYKEMLKSDFADISNMANSRWGGAITAALFLSEFVGETRWAHIDIAGPAYAKKGHAYCGPGGTGFGVRLLCRLVELLT